MPQWLFVIDLPRTNNLFLISSFVECNSKHIHSDAIVDRLILFRECRFGQRHSFVTVLFSHWQLISGRPNSSLCNMFRRAICKFFRGKKIPPSTISYPNKLRRRRARSGGRLHQAFARLLLLLLRLWASARS
jgi:hypothetical protein